MAMATLSRQALAPVASLSSLNPYVGSTLGQWPSKGLQAVVPRQLSPGTTFGQNMSMGEFGLPFHLGRTSLPVIIEMTGETSPERYGEAELLLRQARAHLG